MTPKEVSEFLRILAHDLQNQIGAVDLNLQIMPTLADANDKTIQALSPFISRASVSASEMIETLTDVQTYAYSITDPADRVLTEVDLAALSRDCILAMASKSQVREVTLSLGETSEAFALIDREGVSRGIKLLVTEAMRSSFPGCLVTLSSALTEKSLPSITIHATQEGLFEATRPTLAVFLAREALKASSPEFQYFTGGTRSVLRLVFPAAARNQL
jgi:signal transduction histidine kinase